MTLPTDKTFAAIAECTAEFMRVFDASLDVRLWLTLAEEELKELEAAIAFEPKENVLKEAADLLYVLVPVITLGMAAKAYDMLSSADLARVNALNANFSKLSDYLSENFDNDTTLEAVRRVHRSNMTKLGDDGKPIRREDGKILKGPNYKAPDLSDLVKE